MTGGAIGVRKSTAALLGLLLFPGFALAQAASPFLTGATALQTNILAWLTPIAVILVMVLGAMAMANRMLKSLAARIVFAPKDFADAREISNELGFATVTVRTVSTPQQDFFASHPSRSRSVSVSEHERALLLPQEVKELGTEEAIVFYEGLRPIRCKKIRYFSERRFRKRLLPPPANPTPMARAAARPAGSSSASTPNQPQPHKPPEEPPPSEGSVGAGAPIEEPIMTREATVDDIERIDQLTLQDFATDFSRLEIPQREGRLSDTEMSTAVESFVISLRAR